jgi:hypothetical protein
VNFHLFSPISFVTNALVLPLQSAAMILGMVSSVIGLISISLAGTLALPAYALLSATLRIVEWMARLPGACFPVFDFGTPHAVAYYLTLFGLTALAAQPANERHALSRLVRQNARAWIALAVLIVLVIGGIYVYQRPDGKLHVTFSGVGAFIQTPSGRQVVFAGGGSVLPVMGRAMPLWDKGVELVILPRRDDSARSDTLPLLQRYRAGTVIVPDGEDEPSALLDEWTQQAQTNAARVITVPLGTRAVIEPGVVLTIEQRTGRNGREAIGTRLSYGGSTFVLAGDTGVISGTLGASDVVFVSVRGTPREILNAAQPGWVVWADAGGTPGRLDSGIRAVALRDEGVVEFVSDGERLVVSRP